MMALAATGRSAAALHMIDGMRAFACGNGTIERLVGRVALPLCGAGPSPGPARRGAEADAADPGRHVSVGRQPRPAGRAGAAFPRLATKADSADNVPLILERVSGRHPVPPSRRIGYAGAANARATTRLRCIKNEICAAMTPLAGAYLVA
jgi:hypothetical protein